MLRKLYDWVINLAGSRHAPKALVAVSFAESSFFPIPPDVMLGPMVLARPNKAFVFAALCTAASVIGGMFGYGIGFFLEPVAMWILNAIGHPEGKQLFDQWFDRYGIWAVLIAGFTPIPYKLVTIASGLAHFDLITFIWASALTRGARFFLVAGILKFAGPPLLAEFERRMTLYTVLGVVVLIGGFAALKLL